MAAKRSSDVHVLFADCQADVVNVPGVAAVDLAPGDLREIDGMARFGT